MHVHSSKAVVNNFFEILMRPIDGIDFQHRDSPDNRAGASLRTRAAIEYAQDKPHERPVSCLNTGIARPKGDFAAG
jgi:hypothetical protein